MLRRLIILISVLSSNAYSKSVNYEVVSHFAWDSKVFGTYKKISDKAKNEDGKVRTTKDANGNASIMIQGNNMILIHPVKVDGLTKYEVKKFPLKKLGQRNFEIETKDIQEEVKVAYASILENIVEKENIKNGSLVINNITCLRPKNQIQCKLPISIEI